MGCYALKTKDKRNLVILFILLPVFLWLSLTFTNDNEKSLLPYSVLNKGKEGVSVIYEVFKDLGYTANLVLTEVSSQDINRAQIVVEPREPYKLEIDQDSIKNWIKNGGNLIYLTPRWECLEPNYGEEMDSYTSSEVEHAKAYSYHNGLLVIGDPKILSNKTLTTNTDGAYWLVTQLEKKNINSISFNEYYHYYEDLKPSLWRDIPIGIKFAIYQIILLIVIIIYYYGKRFGKEIPLYEEVERVENEYVYSAASLFRKGELREDVVLNFYNDFLSSLKDSFGYYNMNSTKSWVEVWKQEKLPDVNEAKKLYKFVDAMTNGRKVSSREMLETISNIEHLKKILEKGREVHWRELKRDTQNI